MQLAKSDLEWLQESFRQRNYAVQEMKSLLNSFMRNPEDWMAGMLTEDKLLPLWEDFFAYIHKLAENQHQLLLLAVQDKRFRMIEALINSPGSFETAYMTWLSDNEILPIWENSYSDTVWLQYQYEFAQSTFFPESLWKLPERKEAAGATPFQKVFFEAALNFTKSNFIRERRSELFLDSLPMDDQKEDIYLSGIAHIPALQGNRRPLEMAFQYSLGKNIPDWNDMEGVGLMKMLGAIQQHEWMLFGGLKEFFMDQYKDIQNFQLGSEEVKNIIAIQPGIKPEWLRLLDQIQINSFVGDIATKDFPESPYVDELQRIARLLISGLSDDALHALVWNILRKEPHAWREFVDKSTADITSVEQRFFLLNVDNAMVGDVRDVDQKLAGHPQRTDVGGINFDPALLDLQIKRDGKGIPLPFPQQPPDMRIEGFLPVIISVTPINLPLILGLADEGEKNRQETSRLRLQPLDVPKRQVAVLN